MKKIFYVAATIIIIGAVPNQSVAIIGGCSMADRERCESMRQVCETDNCVYACYTFTLNPTTCECIRRTTPTESTCASGCYGITSNVCQSCPAIGSISGKSAQGSTNITDCYISANTEISENTGTYIFTADCHYSN